MTRISTSGGKPPGRAPASAEAGARRRRGRPRRSDIDEAVLDVALRHLADPGFGRMSIEAIASEAGVGRPAVYRRWPDKAALATAALEHLRVRQPERRRGDTRTRLVSQLERVREFFTRLRGMAMIGALLVEEERHPELLERFRERVIQPRRDEIRRILVDGQESGEVRSDVDVDVAVAALVGSIYSRYLSGEGFGRAWSEEVVATLWPAFAASSGP